MSIFWELRASNAFLLISQLPSETGGIIAPMSSDLPRITQLGKDQLRVRLESRTISPITHENLSEELRVYGLCWVEVIRATSTRGGGGWCPGSSDQAKPSVSGKKMGVEGPCGGPSWQGCGKWLEIKAGAGHSGTKPKSSLWVAALTCLRSQDHIHSFIHSLILREIHQTHRITQADHLFPCQTGSQSVILDQQYYQHHWVSLDPRVWGPKALSQRH